MALWLPPNGKLYLPPAKPIARALSTDEYVSGTSIFFHAGTERLLTVGHPYFEVRDPADKKVLVPKVSGNQFRCFRLLLPDPNKFALIEKGLYNPERERLVWRLRGLEVTRGGPLGIGTTGHPLLNKLNDTENPNKYFPTSTDSRQNVSTDPKQTQMFIVGCSPCVGVHWDAARACADDRQETGDCPPIELVTSTIQDGEMCDIGFGNLNFKKLQEDKAGVPLDIVSTTCKWPDFTKMTNDVYGNSLFFFGRREQMYARHFFTRNGTVGEKIPDKAVDNERDDFYITPANAQQERATITPHIYFPTPSGSLVSSESNLFNRPYWLQRAQGKNNGVLWGNQCFLTIVDNTRGTNFTISVASEAVQDGYNASKFKQYLRHTEEFEVELILQLCVVKLDPDVLAHLNIMDPTILDDWNLAFVPPPANGIEDTYRYIQSLATRCPDQDNPRDKEDPYKDLNFWVVDLREKLSNELSEFSLGRRFMYQTNMVSSSVSKRRRASASTPSTSQRSAAKRRRKA